MPDDVSPYGGGSIKGHGALSPPVSRVSNAQMPQKVPAKSVAFSVPSDRRGRARSGNETTLDQSRITQTSARAGSQRHSSPQPPPPPKEPLRRRDLPSASPSPHPASPSLQRSPVPPSKVPVKYLLPQGSPGRDTAKSFRSSPPSARVAASEESRIIPPPGVPSPVRTGSLYNSPVRQTVVPSAEAEVVVHVEEYTPSPSPTRTSAHPAHSPYTSPTGRSFAGRHWTDSGRTNDITDDNIQVLYEYQYTPSRSTSQQHIRWSERDRELYERYMDVCHEANGERDYTCV